MSRPHYGTKPDANQNEIIEELRARGYDVDIVSSLPGLYDLVVSGDKYMGVEGLDRDVYLPCSVRVEVKMPGKKLNETEKEYHAAQRHPNTLIIAESAEDILRWFGGEG